MKKTNRNLSSRIRQVAYNDAFLSAPAEILSFTCIRVRLQRLWL